MSQSPWMDWDVTYKYKNLYIYNLEHIKSKTYFQGFTTKLTTNVAFTCLFTKSIFSSFQREVQFDIHCKQYRAVCIKFDCLSSVVFIRLA